MRDFINKHRLLILIGFDVILFFIFLCVLYSTSIDNIQKIFSIFSSFSIIFVIASYFYKKNQDRTITAIEQISFFRTEVLPKWGEVVNTIKLKNETYGFSRIKLDEPTIKFLRESSPINFKDQSSIFFDLTKLETEPITEPIDNEVIASQSNLFNTLEEFSLKVLHFNTQDHPALVSLHFPFVELIEKNAVSLIFIREVTVGNPIFSNTLSLYNFWKENVKRVNGLKMLKSLEKNEFISKQKREELEKRIKESRKKLE